MGGRSKAPHGQKVKGARWAEGQRHLMGRRSRELDGQKLKGSR